MCAYSFIIIINSLPKGRSLASKFSNSLGFQSPSSYPHMSHLIHHRSCPFLAFPLVSFLPFSLLAPISSDHPPLQHVQSSSSFCPISFLLSFSFVHAAEYLFVCLFIHPANLSHSSPHPHFKGVKRFISSFLMVHVSHLYRTTGHTSVLTNIFHRSTLILLVRGGSSFLLLN